MSKTATMNVLEVDSPGTQHEFGYEWNIYREILPLHRDQFLRWIGGLGLEFFKGKSFLDAGCGIGRNSYWPLEAGAERGYAFDYDERSVAVAKENLKNYPNCQIELKSIYELFFHAEFDIAFSIGVIHHLANPKKAVERLVAALKPGGTLVLWVYGYEGNEWYLRWVNPIRQAVTSKLPLGLTRFISKCLVPILQIYLLLPHKKAYLLLLRKMSFKHLEAIVFDQLLPSIANYWKKDEVLDLVADLPVNVGKIVHTNGMSWTLIAEKQK